MCSIEGDDCHVAVNTVCNTCRIHCVHRAVCFVIVLAYNYVEIAVGFDKGFHNFLTACLCEVTGLRVKNFPVGVLSYDVVEAFRTAKCSGCANGTFNHKDVCIFPVQILSKPVTRSLTFSNHVAAESCCIQSVSSVNRTVNDKYRNACVLCFLENGVPTSGLDRRDADVVKFLLDKAANCFDLNCMVIIAVYER